METELKQIIKKKKHENEVYLLHVREQKTTGYDLIQ